MKIQQTRYGHYEIGEPYYSREYQGYKRTDLYVDVTGEKTPDRMFARGPDDDSDVVIHPYAGDPGNREYDATCGACWLGHGHTIRSHDFRVGK